MSFIAGYIAGLEEGGSSYKNEPITIKSNGLYIPQNDVRYSEVTVDVPQQPAEIVEQIANLPVHGTFEIGEGWAIDFAVDLDNAVTAALHTGIEYSYVNDQYVNGVLVVPKFYYVSNKFTRMVIYGKFIKDGVFQFAVRNSNQTPDFNKEQRFSTYWHYNNDNKVTDITVYHNQDMEISGPIFSNVGVDMNYDTSIPTIRFRVDYTENWTYYNSDGEIYNKSTSKDGNALDFQFVGYSTNTCMTFSNLTSSQMQESLMDVVTACAHYKGFDDFYFKYK